MAENMDEGTKKPGAGESPKADPDLNNTPTPQTDSAQTLPFEIDDLTWEKNVEKATQPVAVMFYSPTCAFCHQIEPYFRNYAGEYQQRVLFARLNVLTSQWTAERYGVRSTPTFKFFCNGKPVREMVGAVYPALLKKMVDEVLIHGQECARSTTDIDYEITGYG